MSGKAIALTLVLSILFSLLAGTQIMQNGQRTFIAQAETSNSNTIVKGNPDANVTIQSPEKRTYYENNVTLAFTIETEIPSLYHIEGPYIGPVFVDGVVLDYDTSKLFSIFMNAWGPASEFPDNVSTSLSSLENNLYEGKAHLTDLPQGAHNVTVWEAVYQTMISYAWYIGAVLSTVSFNIDSIPPHITILSPEAKVYYTSDVPLDFTVNKTFSQITYSLDGHENITAAGNMTLTGLSNGAHNLTVYATDEAGNIGASQTIAFTIATFPTATVAVVLGTTVAIMLIAGLLFYQKKHKQGKSSSNFSLKR
jgi:hypothetical protein